MMSVVEGARYGAVPFQQPQQEQRGTNARRAVAGAALVATVCLLFFAGRAYEGNLSEFTHEEVTNVASGCGQGEFIGQCTTCTDCKSYEYANGGCSLFKDTFCTYCEPIENCKLVNVVCTDRGDQVCSECDCDDPISSWDDVTKEVLGSREDGGPSYSCYLGEQCEPCFVCPKGFYETEACDPAQGRDTECARCDECAPGFFVASACSYGSNTVCRECSTCDAMGMSETTAQLCSGHPDANQNNIFVQGQDTLCADCGECNSHQFVDEACAPAADTKCEPCASCEEGFFVGTPCRQTEVPTQVGADTVCNPCSPLLDAGSGGFLVGDCDPLDTSDYVYGQCTVCVYGEFETSDCVRGDEDNLGADRTCADCAEIPDCAGQNLCSTGEDETCSRCGQPGVDAGDGRDEDYFGAWDTCCAHRGLGSKCEWLHHDAGCDEGQRNFMERTARRGGFLGESSAEFVLWCKALCEQIDECNAFEVKREIAEGTELPSAGSLCGLKNHASYDFGSGTAAHTCWAKRG